MLTDQGANFFTHVCKLLQIRVLTTAFHRESNGGLERSDRVIVEYLRHIAEDQRDWDEWIAYTTYVYITTHKATGYSPFEFLFGQRAGIPSALQARRIPRYIYDYTRELRECLQSAHAIARENLLQSKARSKVDYDK